MSRSQLLNAGASAGALVSRSWPTARSSSIALDLISATSLTLNLVCSPLRMASRDSAVEKSSETALTSSFACGSLRASSMAQPPAMPSLMRPKRPLGSDAVTAMLDTMTLPAIWLHSCGVKLALLAIACSCLGVNGRLGGRQAVLDPRCDQAIRTKGSNHHP